ncbi:MAG: hypothetical protein P8L23_02470 [Flavobacteriales bacterium]|nr:hypothetical protein [Flavobacteriales bacterium]
MRKAIYIFVTLFMFSSCSNDVSNNVGENKSVSSNLKTAVITTYTLGDVNVKWSAFKHMSKAIVGGEFKEIIITDFKDSNDLYTAIEGLSFQLGVNSTKTGDTLRDYKIYTSFFGTMLNTKYISGNIISLNNDKTGRVLIKMNDVAKEVDFSWDIDQTHEFFLKTSIDVFNWDAKKSLNNLNDVCLEKHTGPDGVNMLWPNVDVIVIAKLNPLN